MLKQKLSLGTLLSTPSYKYQETLLGYETDLICLEGISADKVNLEKVPNTRKKDPFLEELIEKRWSQIKEKYPNAFDAPRARFEGSYIDEDEGRLHIRWSEDRYKTHAVVREIALPKPYQANLFTINGIPLTQEDYKIPLVIRNPKETDQGRIRHIAPAGFIDVIKTDDLLKTESIDEQTIKKLSEELCFSYVWSEIPHKTTERELNEELSYKDNDTFPPEVFDRKEMKILGIVYNSKKNFDYTASVLIPLKTKSDYIGLKGSEHESIEWIGTDYKELKDLLFELSLVPEMNSGHLRGDIALTIGHLYGEKAYREVLEDTVLRMMRYSE